MINAQENIINTDRPDQSDGVATIPFKKFQLEEGINFAQNTFVNDLLLRYGFTKSTELRLLIDAGKENHLNGVQPLTFSIKQKITEQKKWLPAISFVGYISFGQLASKDYTSSENKYILKLAFENEINHQFSLGYNIGTSNYMKDLDITVNLGFAANKKLSTFMEYFSTFNKQTNSHNIDAGILYLINNNFQLDVALGTSIFTKNNQYFGTFGFSYLF